MPPPGSRGSSTTMWCGACAWEHHRLHQDVKRLLKMTSKFRIEIRSLETRRSRYMSDSKMMCRLERLPGSACRPAATCGVYISDDT